MSAHSEDPRMSALSMCLLCHETDTNAPMVRLCSNDTHYYCVECASCVVNQPVVTLAHLETKGCVRIRRANTHVRRLPCLCTAVHPSVSRVAIINKCFSHLANLTFSPRSYRCNCNRTFSTTREVVDHVMIKNTADPCRSVALRCLGCAEQLPISALEAHLRDGCPGISCPETGCGMTGDVKTMRIHAHLHAVRQRTAEMHAQVSKGFDGLVDCHPLASEYDWMLLCSPTAHTADPEFACNFHSSVVRACMTIALESEDQRGYYAVFSESASQKHSLYAVAAHRLLRLLSVWDRHTATTAL